MWGSMKIYEPKKTPPHVDIIMFKKLYLDNIQDEISRFVKQKKIFFEFI